MTHIIHRHDVPVALQTALSFESHPDNEVVIDQMLSMCYESETMNHHANAYALEVVRFYFPHAYQDDEWYANYIGTEEFRDLPEGSNGKRTYEKMYDIYWDARGEWFDRVIQNIAHQNMRESHRRQYMHTLSNNQSWAEYGERVRNQNPRAYSHNMAEDS